MVFTLKPARYSVFVFLIAFSLNSSAQYEHLMDDIVTEMALQGDLDADTAYSEMFNGKLRFWMKLEDLTTNPFMIEVNHFRYLPPTLEQKAFADSIYKKTLENIINKKWYIEKEAIKSGYLLNPDFDSTHYFNNDYLYDGKEFDPKRPEFLIFQPTIYGRVLIGVMFNADTHLGHGPQLGGNLTVWHFHTQPGSCWDGHIRRFQLAVDKYCEQGKYSDRSPEMIHVWFVNHPSGIFGSSMGFRIPLEEIDRVQNLYRN